MRTFAALLISSLFLNAQTTVSQEKGKALVDQVVAALGGDYFLAMRNRVETGRVYSFYREQLTGLSIAKIYTRYDINKVPGDAKLHVRERQAFGKKEDSVVLFLEDSGYQVGYRGAKPIPEETMKRYMSTARNSIFYILLERLKEPGMLIDARGSEIIDNVPTDKVDFTDADNNVVSVYFAKSTHLPVKQVHIRRDPETKYPIEEVTVFTKFRDVGHGVMWPFNMLRLRDGEKVYEIFAESVVINQDLPAKLFELPGSTKIIDETKERTVNPLPTKTKKDPK
jgi:hypothetical protein